MRIEPNSDIYLYVGVPFAGNPTHMMRWASLAEQNSYFSNYNYYYSNSSYVRTDRGVRIQANANNLYNVNYMRFRNTGFVDKWYYANITNVRYISNNVYELDYEIDNFQTWLFEYSIPTCMIERETVADDTVGAHTIDEGLTGDRVIVKQLEHNYKLLDTTRVVIEYTPGTALYIAGKIAHIPNIEPGFIGKNYTGSSYKTFLAGEIDEINNFIDVTLASGNTITNVYLAPSDFFFEEEKSEWLPNIEIPTKYGDYEPMNNKLFTYPYTYVEVMGSNTEEYRFHKMVNNTIGFEQNTSVVPTVECSMIPLQYDGIENNFSKSVTLTGFPVSSWLDSGIRLTGVLNRLLGGISIGSSTKDASENSTETKSQSTSLTFEAEKPNWSPESSGKGRTDTSNAWANDYFGYKCYIYGITEESAKVIDSYLTRYGYKVNTLKAPTRNRQIFDFIRTVDCVVKGNIPVEASECIKKLYDTGVTLWYDITNYGNYEVKNEVIA